jgi:hypothetical protein
MGTWYLQLDDPLSGLDASTKRTVFSEAIGPASLTAGRTRLIVTQTRMCNRCRTGANGCGVVSDLEARLD